jgi:hypothetical protein
VFDLRGTFPGTRFRKDRLVMPWWVLLIGVVVSLKFVYGVSLNGKVLQDRVHSLSIVGDTSSLALKIEDSSIESISVFNFLVDFNSAFL